MDNISVAVAFGAGLLSFLSPCVLPLVPVYIASLCGGVVYEPGSGRRRLPVFLHSLSFVVGFTVVFVLLGSIAGLTGFAINPNLALLSKIAGSLMIAFGLFILAARWVPWLNYTIRFSTSANRAPGYLRSLFIGAVFSLGWTACVGPVLGGILALALNSGVAWRGAYLLAIYSLGLGLPFLIIGAAFDSITPVLKQINRFSGYIYFAGSLLLIAMGVLVLTNNLSWFYSIST